MRNPFWGILALCLVAALVLLAGCATGGGYQSSESGYYQGYDYSPTTSGGTLIGPPPGAGG
jgi:hypothetical protein